MGSERDHDLLKVAQPVDSRVVIPIQVVVYFSFSEDFKDIKYYNLSLMQIEGGEFIVPCLNLVVKPDMNPMFLQPTIYEQKGWCDVRDYSLN